MVVLSGVVWQALLNSYARRLSENKLIGRERDILDSLLGHKF